MASRNLLHVNKLEDFIRYLDEVEIPHRPGKGEYQILQVYTESHGWRVVHKRLDMKEHYTVDERLVPLVKRFIDLQHLKPRPLREEQGE
jgi:hypothetical protein